MEAIFRWVLFGGVAIGQTMENVMLPLAVNQDVSMCVVLLFCSFFYMLFFTLLDSLMEPVAHVMGIPPGRRHLKVHDPNLILVSLGVSFAGVGAVFGASPERTPLPLQMAMFMISNLCAARFKIWALGIKGIPWFGMGTFQVNYWIAAALYVSSFLCVVIDRVFVADVQGKLSPYCLFFAVSVFMNMFLNVQMEKAMQGSEENLVGATYFEYFKQYISMLRRMLTWMFLFCWIGVLFSLMGFDSHPVSRDTFEGTWATFLPLGNLYMNLFNTGYIIVFLTSAFLNKMDASLTATASNVATVISVLAGFLPTIGKEAVGYAPNPYLTIAAVVFAAIGLYPSEKYSKVLRDSRNNTAYAIVAKAEDGEDADKHFDGVQYGS